MLKKILIGLLVVVVLLLVVSFFLPSTYEVSRSTVINAPIERVFAQFNDFNNWKQWNTFDDSYKDIQYTVSNPSAGVGAKQSWTSKDGNGSMEITESIPNKSVKMLLQFEGFEKHPMMGSIDFETVEQGTKVTWTDNGSVGNNPLWKYMCLMTDPMIGKNMEKSFENVRGLCR